MTSVSTDRRYGINSGIAIKVPCKATTTANITLSGEQTIDGISCVTSDRVLVKNQTTGTENGIYRVDTGAWSRDVDFDGSYDITQGTIIPVYSGSTYGATIWQVTTSNPVIGTSSLTFSLANAIGLETNLAASTGAGLVGCIGSLVGSVARTQQDKNRDFVDARDVGIVADGSTDQTSALTTVFTNNPNYRGVFRIPYNTKFTFNTVYNALPVGYILWDESSINTGQPPGYKNKSIRIYTNDSASDDASFVVMSSHHATIRLNNRGTAGTSSASGKYNSIIRGVGRRWNGDLIDGMQHLTFKSPRGNLWRTSDILNTPYNYAVNGASEWTASTVYAANAIVNTDDGNVYQTTAGGTSGSTKPTGTGTGINDGGVLWDYLGKWSAGSTVVYHDEDGYGGISGPSSGRWAAESANKRGCSINVTDATGEVYLADDQLGVKLINRTDALGIQVGLSTVQSLPYGGNLTGATPTLVTSFHTMSQSGATTVTNFLLPGSQTDGYVTILFTDGNTTLNHLGSFTLKGNVNVTPASGNIMVFLKRASTSSDWFEVSRNF